MQLQRLFDLSGRTALVTGGGRGIGRHIAIGLAEAGADVFVASRNRDSCQETVRAVEKLGRRGRAFACDVAREEDLESLCTEVFAETQRLDVLINNAGAIWGAPTLEYPIEGWDKVFAVNVRGLWLLTQRVARQMAEQGGGSIVHVSSISGFRGSWEEKEPSIAYSASKGAVHTLTKDLAVKLAPHGIRVNAIAPGAFDTDMMDYVKTSPETLTAFLEQIPMKRAGEEDDVKGVAVFLASEAARYVTGHVLVVDGGWSAL